MVEVLFVLFVSLAGHPYLEAARYSSPDECRAAVDTLQLAEVNAAGEWQPGEVKGACLALQRPRASGAN